MLSRCFKTGRKPVRCDAPPPRVYRAVEQRSGRRSLLPPLRRRRRSRKSRALVYYATARFYEERADCVPFRGGRLRRGPVSKCGDTRAAFRRAPASSATHLAAPSVDCVSGRIATVPDALPLKKSCVDRLIPIAKARESRVVTDNRVIDSPPGSLRHSRATYSGNQ